MCWIPDTYPVSDTIRRFLRYPISGRTAKYRYCLYQSTGTDTGYFQSSGKLRGVGSVKIKFTFSIYVKKFGASLKTLILFGLSTNSRTVSKPWTALVIFYIKWI